VNETPRGTELASLLSVLDRYHGKHIWVVGDLMLDESSWKRPAAASSWCR
jgi:hypothetical protein